MASNRYNVSSVPAVQQGTQQGPLNSAVRPSSPALAQLSNAPTQTANQSNRVVTEHHGKMNVEGVHIQFRNVAIREESFRANVSNPTVKSPTEATASYTPQLSSPGAQSSQHASLPCPPSPASPSSPQGVPLKPLQVTGGERGLVPGSPEGQSLPSTGAGPAVLERTGHAEKVAGEGSMQEMAVKTSNLALAARREEVLVEGEHQVVRQEIELTDDGQVRLREYIHTERVFYRHVIEVLYIAALNEPEDPEEEKVKEKCIIVAKHLVAQKVLKDCLVGATNKGILQRQQLRRLNS